ncbi:cohesin domain-containing protein [Rubripirellula amarantea]|nr:cohesin domain-containing protein [Rubripirellula amarantea]
MLERLEVRLPLAGDSSVDLSKFMEFLSQLDPQDQAAFGDILANLENQNAALKPTEPVAVDAETEVVRLRLDTRNSVPKVGEQFTVDIWIKDFSSETAIQLISKEATGLFQAKFDLSFNPDVVEPLVDQIVLDERYVGEASLSSDTAGLLQNVGGIIGALSGSALAELELNEDGEFILAKVPFRVIGTGNAEITPTPIQTGESFLIFGSDTPIPDSNVTLPSLNLTIDSGPEDQPVVDSPADDSDSPPVVTPIDFVQYPSYESLQRYPDQSTEWMLSRLEWQSSNQDDIDDRINDDDAKDLADALPAKEDNPDSLPLDLQADQQPLANKGDDEGEGEAESGNERVRFWREYDLDMLDDEAAVSLLELHFRVFQLRLAEEPSQPTSPRAETDHRPSLVIDAGMADISVWLANPNYRSWKREPQPKIVDKVITDAVLADDEWQPSGKTARLQRLETAEEVNQDPVVGQSDLFRRYGDVDAKTEIPESEAL